MTSWALTVFSYLWSLDQVPTAKELSDWTESHPDKPHDWRILVQRLRAWPEGRAYPPIPDDDALAHGVSESDKRWWTPGAEAMRNAETDAATRTIKTLAVDVDKRLTGGTDHAQG